MININSNTHSYQAAKSDHVSKSKDVEELKELHKESKAKQFAQVMSEVQSFVKGRAEESSFEVQYQEFQEFLEGIEYEGPAIASLSQEEAAELVSEDGFFGVKQTSIRIAEFVIAGAGGDEELRHFLGQTKHIMNILDINKILCTKRTICGKSRFSPNGGST